jgi:hypothetical protein
MKRSAIPSPPLRGRVREGGSNGSACGYPPLQLSPARGERADHSRGEHGCLSRSTTSDSTVKQRQPDIASQSRRRFRASSALNVRPSIKQRAWGMPGARRHPQPRVRLSIHSEVAEITRHSRTRWFTAYTALSSAIGLSCHRRLRRLLRKLDAGVEASGPHDFAVRVGAVRYRHVSVHRIPPRVRDDREPPLRWDGTATISR